VRQIFHPSTNNIARVSIFGAIFFIAGLAWVLVTFFRSPFMTKVNMPIEQPVQFSHAHHAGGLGIDCRYCHASVDDSSFADLPPTHTCMTCHSQIWIDSPALEPVRASYQTGQSIPWNRVNNVPDYVYFNHQIHVTKGIGCETCHGRVDQMPLVRKTNTLYMEWCLDCHRAPEKYIRPASQVFTMGYTPSESQTTLGRKLVSDYHIPPTSFLTDCFTCHR
jgi:hypothetical protein